MPRSLIICCLLAVATPIVASAQTKPAEPKTGAPLWLPIQSSPLAFITGVFVDNSSDREDTNSRCAPPFSSLRLAASRGLMDSGVKVVPASSADYPTLWLSVVAIDTSSTTCAAWVALELTGPALAVLRYQQLDPENVREVWNATKDPHPVIVAGGTVSLSNRGTLFTGARVDFHDRITEFLRSAATEIATEIRLANQKK